MNLFVGNISKLVRTEALQALFSEFGEVASAHVVVDNITKESKGFGFVEMPNDYQANEAIYSLTNAVFFGSKLFVSKARPRDSR